MRYLSGLVLGLAVISMVPLVGCGRAAPETPREGVEQEEKMREWLNESSPRALNNLPKATPEVVEVFRNAYPGEPLPPPPPLPPSPEVTPVPPTRNHIHENF